MIVPSIRVKTHRRRDEKPSRSNDNNFISNEDKWNGSPLLIKHKSIGIDEDKWQRDRIKSNKWIP
jgi:hypothetical protein